LRGVGEIESDEIFESSQKITEPSLSQKRRDSNGESSKDKGRPDARHEEQDELKKRDEIMIAPALRGGRPTYEEGKGI